MPSVIIEHVEHDYRYNWCGNNHSFINIEYSVITRAMQRLPEANVGLCGSTKGNLPTILLLFQPLSNCHSHSHC